MRKVGLDADLRSLTELKPVIFGRAIEILTLDQKNQDFHRATVARPTINQPLGSRRRVESDAEPIGIERLMRIFVIQKFINLKKLGSN